jgi:hypothetical protein
MSGVGRWTAVCILTSDIHVIFCKQISPASSISDVSGNDWFAVSVECRQNLWSLQVPGTTQRKGESGQSSAFSAMIQNAPNYPTHLHGLVLWH